MRRGCNGYVGAGETPALGGLRPPAGSAEATSLGRPHWLAGPGRYTGREHERARWMEGEVEDLCADWDVGHLAGAGAGMNETSSGEFSFVES